jgi:hypothetical protein
MTAGQQALIAGLSNIITGAAVVADTKAGANAIANIYLQTAGNITYAGSGSSGPPNWWLGGGTPPTHYCTNTVNSGSNPTTGTPALYPTTSTCLWQWTTSAVGTVSANCTLRIYSDAAGTQLAGTINYTVTCTRTS